MSATNTFIKKNAAKSRLLLLSSVAVFSIINCLNLPAFANSIVYSAPSDNQSANFTGEVPVKQIGSLLLPKAVVQFKNTDVNILAVPDWLFDRSVVLSGALVKVQVSVQGQNSNLNGLVYFFEGQWLSNLGSINAIDTIDTISGERLRGRIRSRLDNAFAFKPETGPMQKVSFNDIKNINSPRAYVFSIISDSSKVVPANLSIEFDANSLAFSPTFGRAYAAKTAKVPKSTLAGTEPGITNNEIALLTGANILIDLAPAVAIPLTLNQHNTAQAQQTINLYLSEQSRAQGLPVPLNYSTHGP
jgi:hypothetical protein